MPSAQFFRDLGFVVLKDFLDPSLCLRLCKEMSAARAEKGTIFLGEKNTVDETSRKVLYTAVEESASRIVAARLHDLRATLSEHFEVPLGHCEPPSF